MSSYHPELGLLLVCAAGCIACSDPGGSIGDPATGSGAGAGAGSPSGGDGGAASTVGAAQGGSAPAGGGGSGGQGFPPGPPGCGLDAAAFCETFDAPAGKPTRAGELDPTRWSASRMCNIGGPSGDGEAVAIGPATVPSCRSGLPAKVLPSEDALVCDSNAQIQSNHLLMLVAAQNYGQNSYRIRQPFDFANRTGRIVFDAEGYNVGNQGWISLEVSEDPTPAPSFTFGQNFENGAIPRNAVEVQLYHNCGGGKVGISDIIVYDDYAQTSVMSYGTDCADAAQGKLNRFEVRLSDSHIDVYATPASDDGLTFGDAVLIGSVDVVLPLSRGYVSITTHNHATLKYSNDTVDAWVARWDNVGFDGPAITSGWRENEALDSLTDTGSGKVDVGWRLADASGGPAQTIEIHDVDLTGVVGARLALENWSLHPAGSEPLTDFALNYRLNGHAWKARTLTPSELQMMIDLPNAGTRSMMLDVDVADLVPGTNTLELTTSNAPMSDPPVVLNVDLVLATQ